MPQREGGSGPKGAREHSPLSLSGRQRDGTGEPFLISFIEANELDEPMASRLKWRLPFRVSL